eukprot:TRINITY_DN18001_c0_g1_i1.p1 TRINITY_DN18001_c0_g1~~TRINITY_DN18001_c0_g1_i1.p1  ORF type:complete len:353 (+),score=87.32 TRINITY_DN18001_c0_g1_i1:120-1178(+)
MCIRDRCGADQIAIQRYMSTPSLESSQRTALVGGLLNAGMSVLLGFLGIGLFAYYHSPGHSDPYCLRPDRSEIHDCHKVVDSADQMLPYFFVSEFEGTGLPGAIVAAILGCTMSVYSSGLNAATTCTVVDILQNECGRLSKGDHGSGKDGHDSGKDGHDSGKDGHDSGKDGHDSGKDQIMSASRKVTGIFGILTMAVAVASTVVGRGLVELCVAALGLTGGPVLGTFMLGMLTTKTSGPAAEAGLAAGLVAMVYFAVGQGMCSDGDCSGFMVLGNMNEFMYCPVLTAITTAVGYGTSCCLRADHVPANLDDLTVWTKRPRTKLGNGSYLLAEEQELDADMMDPQQSNPSAES